MDTIEKLKLLSRDSQYDLACSCGTNKYDRRKKTKDGKWLYPVPLPQGGYSILLKTLMSNACANDCKYCPLRSKSNIERCTLNPDETAKVFLDYVDKAGVFGLFLSSGIINTPDHTMEKLIDTASILRRRHKYKGYIHLKIIPGASDAAIVEAASVSTALSLNIETPGKKFFDKLSVKKDFESDILRPLRLMAKLTEKGARHSKVKCSTQFIVGASDEADSDIVKYVFGIYDKLNFRRVYFSAYQPGLGAPDIPGERRFQLNSEDLLTREHRLYQVDFLIRQYGFQKSDILFGSDGNLSLSKDPKEAWADNNPSFFPVNLNNAPREVLLRVPGIGPVLTERIIALRKIHRIRSLSDISVKGKLRDKISTFTVF